MHSGGYCKLYFLKNKGAFEKLLHNFDLFFDKGSFHLCTCNILYLHSLLYRIISLIFSNVVCKAWKEYRKSETVVKESKLETPMRLEGKLLRNVKEIPDKGIR